MGSRSILSSQVSRCCRATHYSANEETSVQEENNKPRGCPPCKLAEMRSQIQVTLGQIGFPANRHIPSGRLPTSPVRARVPWDTTRLRRLKSLFSLEDSVPGRCKEEVKADGLQGGTGKEALGSIGYTCTFWKNWKCSTEGGRRKRPLGAGSRLRLQFSWGEWPWPRRSQAIHIS